MKEPMPPIELDDVDIKALSRAELKKVPCGKWKLYCQIKGCKKHTTVKDYGIWPEVFGNFRSGDWINLNERVFICESHWKLYSANDFKDAEVKETKLVDDINKTIWKE